MSFRKIEVTAVRTMEIPCRPETRSFSDLLSLYRTRLIQRPDTHASLSMPLLSYMLWPNDAVARDSGRESLSRWFSGYDEPLNFNLICEHWAHVADIVNLHYAIARGEHQRSRGGASVGKAIYLASRLIKNRGAKEASLWRHWERFKDVAHLAAAAVFVCLDIRTRHRQQPFGIGLQDLHPVRVVSLWPDLVIGLALTYENYGLNSRAEGGAESMLDPQTTWRIPPDINIDPVPALARVILPKEKVILNGRRAGNRGRRYKTTLISA